MISHHLLAPFARTAAAHTLRRTIALAAITLIPFIASAHDFCVDGIYYDFISDSEVEVTYKGKKYDKGKCYKGNVTIPSSVEYNGVTYPVTRIGFCAFNRCPELTSIEIPNSVTSIRSFAFCECTALDSVVIPNTVTEIEDHTFRGCSNLKSIEIPNSITRIGKSAFARCSSLETITFPEGVEEILNNTFFGCDRLKTIRVPETLRSIEPGALSIGFNRHKGIEKYPVAKREAPIDYYTNAKSSQSKSGGESAVQAPQVVKAALPNLAVVDGSVRFVDADGTNVIDADENCYIEFDVTNTGKGVASGCVAKCDISSNSGITVDDQKLSVISPGATVHVKMPLTVSHNTRDGKAELIVRVIEYNGFDTEPFSLVCETRAYQPPRVLMADYAITGSNGAVLSKRESFKLQMLVQNASATGTAEDVAFDIVLPPNVLMLDGELANSLGNLAPGESRMLECELIVNARYEGTAIPITLNLSEKYGKYATRGEVALQLSQPMAANRLEIKGNRPAPSSQVDMAVIAGGIKQSDIDKDIPAATRTRDKTFAVVIANENYRYESSVPFATSDGQIMAQYLHRTLGIPEKNIKIFTDATLNDIRQGLNWLSGVDEAYKGEASIVVYYAGHGMPDESSYSAYLIPADGTAKDKTTCFALSEMSQRLGAMQSSSVLLVMDACFSGSSRGQGMLASATRGVRIKPKEETVGGNMVMFSATQGDETAWPLEREGHGLFTYHLLKKLKETSGNVTLGELFDYVHTAVSQSSIVENAKPQTPSLTASPAIGTSWRQWKF